MAIRLKPTATQATPTPRKLRPHPLADMFPLIEGQEFADLVDDIDAHGVRQPILITDTGLILDGRNRHRACQHLGIETPTEVTDLPPDQWTALVISLNLKRRHLSVTQRSTIATELANLGQGRPEKTGKFAGLIDAPPVSQAEAAKLLNVSERSVRAAVAVREKAPELMEEMKAGHLSVSAASELAKLPADERAAAVELPQDERIVAMRAKAKAMRAHAKAKKRSWERAVAAQAKATKRSWERAVLAGTIEVSAAAEIAKKPTEEQQAVLDAAKRGMRPERKPSKDIHEARLSLAAEEADPGVTERTVFELLEAGHEPTKAAVRQALVAAVERGPQRGPRKDNKNPMFVPDPLGDDRNRIVGLCNQAVEIIQRRTPADLLGACFNEGERKRMLATIRAGIAALRRFEADMDKAL